MRSRRWLLVVAVLAALGGAVALGYSSRNGFAAALAILAVILAITALTNRTKPPSSSDRTSSRALNPETFDVVFGEMSEAVFIVDAQLRVVAHNRAAQNLFPNLLNKPTRLTEITNDTKIHEAFSEGLRGQARESKIELYQDGPRTFDVRVVGSEDGASPVAIGFFREITESDRLQTVRQEFLSNVSHELRTPLTSIMALAETLQAGAVDDAENNRRFLGIIQKNSKRLQHLLDDILELSTIESGNVTIHRESVGLASIVDDVVNSLSAKAAARSISIVNDVTGNVTVFVDPRRLVQMLTNLVDNAIKFNRENGTITISHKTVANRDRIHVRDTGEGIPNQHLDRIFERFYRVDRARSRNFGGTGLGLAIVKHLARAHEGEVTVASRTGKGTEFVIELPRSSESIKTSSR